MFRKIHRKLTLVFAGISSLIVIVMSLSYLYISERQLNQTSYEAFQNDMKTLITNLESQSVISYEWLAKTERQGKYLVSIYDNDVAFSYNENSKQKEEQLLIDQILQDYTSNNSSVPVTPFSSRHTEFIYRDSDNSKYYTSIAWVPRETGQLVMVVIQKTAELQHSIFQQRMMFGVVDFLFTLVIFLFCWFFTGYLLRPIEENQKKQIQFIASASHELRTPLAVMLSSLSACEKADEEERKVFLQTIRQEGNQLSALIDDMLTLAAADNHAWTLQKENVELDTLLLTCYEAFDAMTREKNIAFSIHLPEDAVALCLCDKKRITQVISILLHNAISYTPEGGSIDLTLLPNHKIQISDTGVGIADEDKPHIFDRFYRAEHSHNETGHFGLGLCIAKEIVDAHKGTLILKDNIPHGSCFILQLSS